MFCKEEYVCLCCLWKVDLSQLTVLPNYLSIQINGDLLDKVLDISCGIVPPECAGPRIRTGLGSPMSTGTGSLGMLQSACGQILENS